MVIKFIQQIEAFTLSKYSKFSDVARLPCVKLSQWQTWDVLEQTRKVRFVCVALKLNIFNMSPLKLIN